MIGMPHETRQDIIKTINLMSKLQKIAPDIIHSGPQLFRPYPGGELYDYCVKSGYYEPKTLREWYAANPGDFLATGKYTWMTDQAFTLDMIMAMILVDKENSRAWPMTPDFRTSKMLLKPFLRKIAVKLANKRYERGYWKFMVDMKLARRYI